MNNHTYCIASFSKYFVPEWPNIFNTTLKDWERYKKQSFSDKNDKIKLNIKKTLKINKNISPKRNYLQKHDSNEKYDSYSLISTLSQRLGDETMVKVNV